MVSARVMRGGRRAGDGAGTRGLGGQGTQLARCTAEALQASLASAPHPCWSDRPRSGRSLREPAPRVPAHWGRGARLPSGGARCRSPAAVLPTPGSYLWWCTQTWRLPKPKTPAGPSLVCKETSKGPFPRLNAQASFCLKYLHLVLPLPLVGLLCQISFLQT